MLPGHSWSTFLSNHMDVTAACDFFVVPTLTFKSLYVFVVLSHDRRKILHVKVTAHPTAEWTARRYLRRFRIGHRVPCSEITMRSTVASLSSE